MAVLRRWAFQYNWGAPPGGFPLAATGVGVWADIYQNDNGDLIQGAYAIDNHAGIYFTLYGYANSVSGTLTFRVRDVTNGATLDSIEWHTSAQPVIWGKAIVGPIAALPVADARIQLQYSFVPASTTPAWFYCLSWTIQRVW